MNDVEGGSDKKQATVTSKLCEKNGLYSESGSNREGLVCSSSGWVSVCALGLLAEMKETWQSSEPAHLRSKHDRC